MSTPPEWFVALFRGLMAHYPAWPARAETAMSYWAVLRDLDQRALERAALRHMGTRQFAPAASELRDLARADRDGPALSAAEAWDELYRNRHRIGRRSPTWTSEAVRRAAEAVRWDSADWMTEQLPTIRAQFERYFVAIRDKQAALDLRAELDAVLDMPPVRGALGAGGRELYGADVRD